MPGNVPTYSADPSAALLLQRIAAESADLLLVLDPALRVSAFNASFRDHMRALYGVEPEIGRALPAQLAAHGEDAAAVTQLFERAVQGEGFTTVMPFGPAGLRQHYEISCNVLRDEAGAVEHVFTLARNVEARERERTELERLRAELEERVRERTAELADLVVELEKRQEESTLERERLRTVLDVLPVGVWIADEQGRLIARNRAGIRIWGEDAPMSSRPEEYSRDYRGWWPDGREIRSDEWGLARALVRGETSEAEELEILAHDGRRRTVLNYALPIRGADGGIAGAVAVNVDITERKRDDRAREFLSEASRVLASSLDYPTTLQRIAQLTLPYLADYCIVDILDAGLPRRVAAAHSDPAKQHMVERILAYPPMPVSTNVVSRVLRGEPAESAVIGDIDPLTLSGNRPGLAEVIAELGPRCYLCVPMTVAGCVVGSILLVRTTDRGYDEHELEVANELARRAATAVDNAQRHTAELAARAEAEEASRVKSQFLATMSHELRTPLTGIIGYAELLDEQVTGPLSDAQRVQLARIRTSAWHLVTIIDEILLFARTEAGREQVRLSSVNVAALVQESAAIVEPQARAKALALEVLPLPPNATLRTDQGKLRQILLNLLGNAVKFTDRGGITVRLELHADSAEISVTDTGPGVAADQLERIFEPFTQVDSSNTRDKGGTGLGLTVSRRLAHMLGGELTVASRFGEGSTFLLRIPRPAEGG